MKTKAIIICAGEATRWANYLNTPKHLIEIEGEKILHRTARLLYERGITDINIVIREPDERYETPFSNTYIAKRDQEKNADADKFLSSKELWNNDGRTLVIYGDCYFTEEAMDTIVNFDKREWTLFCRPNESKITGTPWGECFVQSFYPEHIQKHEEKLHEIAELKKSELIKRCGGWEHYRAMVGIDPKKHRMTTNFVKIDDWTDDFDYPKDFDEWMRRWKIKNQIASWSEFTAS